MFKINRVFIVCLTIAFSILISSVVAIASSNYYYDNGYATGGQKLTANYWKDSSVSSYGWGSLSDIGAAAWNGISSKIGSSAVTSEPVYYSAVVYAGSSISGMSVYAYTDYYTYGLFGWSQVSQDSTRDRSRIRIDNTNMVELGVTTDGYKKQKDVMIHEFGHVFSLKHNDIDADSVMKATALTTYGAPTASDKQHLKEKWGN